MRTAVILAARKEYDSKIPYPLMPLDDGSCLIQRTIDNLVELNFNKIFLVVGFCAQAFEQYASQYVQVIRNEDYAFTASMGSLAMVAPLVNEDFLLIEGDVFYEKKVLKTLCESSYDNCLSLTEESGNGDEAFAETKNGFVTKISKDRHRIVRFAGEMLGITKLSLNTFRRMIELWKESNNPYVNYEYVLFDVTDAIERPYIMFPNLIWGDVDCRSDYEKLINDTALRLRRKENPFDRANLLECLGNIFSGQDVGSATIEQIGGMSNKNFKVTFNNKEYVLRVPGNGSEGMVERKNEECNSMLGCEMGVNPSVLYFNSETGVKLTDFISNAETLNSATIQRTDNLKAVTDILKRLHNSSVRLNNEFNVFHEIIRYEQLMQLVGAEMYEGWQKVRKAIFNLESYLNELGIALKPCHNDLVPENLIKDECGKVYLIDWEYSGMNDPMSDLAAMFLEANFSEENIDYVLNRYFDGDVPANTKLKIIIYQILLDYLWAIWTVVKEAKGDDFGTYGRDRYYRAIVNLKKLNRI